MFENHWSITHKGVALFFFHINNRFVEVFFSIFNKMDCIYLKKSVIISFILLVMICLFCILLGTAYGKMNLKGFKLYVESICRPDLGKIECVLLESQFKKCILSFLVKKANIL